MAEQKAKSDGDFLISTAPTGKRVIMSFAPGRYSPEAQERIAASFAKSMTPAQKARFHDLASDIVVYVNPDEGLVIGSAQAQSPTPGVDLGMSL